MAQLLAIDYGKSRCGIAVTDELQIIASPLQSVATLEIFQFLEKYFLSNKVQAVIVGLPVDLRGKLSMIEQDIQEFIKKFSTLFPTIDVLRVDERFTSKMASYYISQSGKSKKEREKKGMIDKISATIILQNYLDQKK